MHTMQMMNRTTRTRKVPGFPSPMVRKEVRTPPSHPPPVPVRVDCL